MDFWSEWCPPCRALNPVLEEIAAEHPELKILKLNADENPDVALEADSPRISARHLPQPDN